MRDHHSISNVSCSEAAKAKAKEAPWLSLEQWHPLDCVFGLPTPGNEFLHSQTVVS